MARVWDAHRLARFGVAAETALEGIGARAMTPRVAPPAELASQGLEADDQEDPPSRPALDELLGRLDVPRIGLSAAVREGVGDATLDVAIGHIPGSALPGTDGNAALAAHRDTEFGTLRNIRVGDEIVFAGPAGASRYRVSWARVLPPYRTDVLKTTLGSAELTLVTCYPFGYVGRAPKRFVVRATKV